MTKQHPITPPPELVQQWYNTSPHANEKALQDVANAAAQWGADQELEACCEWLHWQNLATHSELIPSLRAARRPKPPSLKAQALEAMHRNWNPHNNDDFATIRRALEALND